MLASTPARRSLHTDCKANVTTINGGRQRATAGKKAAARIWVSIFNAIDDEQSQADAVVWMPAHKAQNQIGIATKSNGKPISAVDWLANMAVDELAKSAAHSVRVPPQTLAKLDRAQKVAAYWRTQLAEATYRSQNHLHTSVLPDGTTHTETKRDSDGRPAGNSRPDGAGEESSDDEGAPAHPPTTPSDPPPAPPPPPQPVQAPSASTCNDDADSIYNAKLGILEAEQRKAARRARLYPCA